MARKQVTFWLNPDKQEQKLIGDVLAWYAKRGIDASDIIRRGILIAYYADTGNIAALLEKLPATAVGVVGGVVSNPPQYLRQSDQDDQGGFETQAIDRKELLSNADSNLDGLF